MKVTREQAGENRDRVLAESARLFRERGFAGIGVADLMKAAGLTHGAFYGQFASKEALMAQACERALGESLDTWAGVAQANGEKALSTVVQGYLSTAHRDNPGQGCVMAALGGEAPRQGSSLRRSMTEGVRGFFDLFAGLVPGRGKAARRARAISAFSALVGALVLARAVDDDDLSLEILRTVSSALTGPPPTGG